MIPKELKQLRRAFEESRKIELRRSREICMDASKMKQKKTHLKRWSDFKKPKTFEDALEWLEYCHNNGDQYAWSIQYWGFGEHFTFWPGDGSFTDFNIDKGTMFDLPKMKDIIIQSSQAMYEHLRKDKSHLFRKDKILGV